MDTILRVLRYCCELHSCEAIFIIGINGVQVIPVLFFCLCEVTVEGSSLFFKFFCQSEYQKIGTIYTL